MDKNEHICEERIKTIYAIITDSYRISGISCANSIHNPSTIFQFFFIFREVENLYAPNDINHIQPSFVNSSVLIDS